ncbi:hypothetical protein [Ensifer sp. LCM 4579]|uniref:hypothetical protein n=1 Tax=Ensifer sp. LCM 4579 TaxID=1848292 RepID=UPI001041C170|nr:hypothetical protein [Ensifer sp. LCM 4579]
MNNYERRVGPHKACSGGPDGDLKLPAVEHFEKRGMTPSLGDHINERHTKLFGGMKRREVQMPSAAVGLARRIYEEATGISCDDPTKNAQPAAPKQEPRPIA